MKNLLAVSFVLAFAQAAHSADIEAGKQMAATVCAACHGANGVSVSDVAPHLAAQRAGYIEAQLKAYKEGTRKGQGTNAPAVLMNAVAAQLSAEDIANVAAWFAAQPGAAPGAKSALLANVVKTSVTFPEGYKDSFTKYHTINFPVLRQVRYYFANPVALAAAKAGKPLPDGSMIFIESYAAKLDADNKPVVGADGFYVADRLLQYSSMAREAGWGDDIPALLRNENWNYAFFTPDKQRRTGVNQADCLACHKPLDKVSYLFTLKQLSDVK